MAANTHVRTFWDVFVTFLVKLAAYFGLAVPASRTTAPAAPRPETVPGTRFLPTAEAVRHWAPAPRTEPAPRPVPVGAAASGPSLPGAPDARIAEVPSSRGPSRRPSGLSVPPVSVSAPVSTPLSPASPVPSVTSSLPPALPSRRAVPVVPEPSRGLEPTLCRAAVTGADELSLPPTMKQRIRAEAHGASPVARVRTRPIGDAGLDPALSDATEAPVRAPRSREWALCA